MGRAGRRKDEAGLRFGRTTGIAGRGLYRAANGAENERKRAEFGAGRVDLIGMWSGGQRPRSNGVPLRRIRGGGRRRLALFRLL